MTVKNVEKKENSTAIFQVEIDADAFESAVNSAYKRLKGQIYVAGFRKGKAPRAVIEGMYGHDIFHEEAVQILAPDAFEQAVKEAELEAVGAPAIADFNVGEDGGVTITFSTEIYPEVTLGQYRGLEAPWTEPGVSDEEVDAEIERARKNGARYVDVDRPVQKGDTIVLDFEGFVDGVPFEGGKAENYSLEIGSGMLHPRLRGPAGRHGGRAGRRGQRHLPRAVQPRSSPARTPPSRSRSTPCASRSCPSWTTSSPRTSASSTPSTSTRPTSRQDCSSASRARESDFHAELLNEALENMTVTVPESMVAEKADEFLRNYADNMGLRRQRLPRRPHQEPGPHRGRLRPDDAPRRRAPGARPTCCSTPSPRPRASRPPTRTRTSSTSSSPRTTARTPKRSRR